MRVKALWIGSILLAVGTTTFVLAKGGDATGVDIRKQFITPVSPLGVEGIEVPSPGPAFVQAGGSAILEWQATNAAFCYVYDFRLPTATGGVGTTSPPVYPDSTGVIRGTYHTVPTDPTTAPRVTITYNVFCRAVAPNIGTKISNMELMITL